MDTVLNDVKFEFALAYIDDVIVYSHSFSDHLMHVDAILHLLQEHKMKVGLPKCNFAVKEVHYLGHVVSAEGISPDPQHIKQILDWKPPQNPHEVKQFTHLCGYYREFILHFADIAEPLTALTRKDVEWKWTAKEQSDFEALQRAITTAPVLAYPSFDRPFILATDASDFAIGSVLEQLDDNGKLHPIAFLSRTLNSTERKYSATERVFVSC
jgi:hypothetical protein